ncbi:MAG TPA: TonB-dependent receptor [Sphingobium sp.]|nr:TonB-dependent receptor [Sphingobium sp.]
MTVNHVKSDRAALRLGTAIAALAAMLGTPMAALAQGGQDDGAGEERAIVVTGSRVIRDGFSAPTPVTVISGEQLLTSTPTTIGEGLNKLPQFANSIRPSSAQFAPESGAATQLNLRSLGAQRGLILLNGRRLNPSTATGVVDIAILPEELVQRVDIVTGGASAAYGSDAVAGVVNFILDEKFTGLKGTVQAGVTERGDNLNEKAALTFGTPLGDRAHLLVSGTFYNADGVLNYRKRDWFNSCAPLNNPVTGAGQPARVQKCGAATPMMAAGGLIVSGPLAGTQFVGSGEPTNFQYGDFRTATMMVGGTGEDQGLDFQPLPELRRTTGYARLSYDVTEGLTLSADALLAQSKSRFNGTLMQFYGQTALTIYRDNAFLPAAIGQRMDDLNLTSFSLGTSMPSVGLLDNHGTSDTARFTVGLQGDIGGGWSIDSYYAYGTNQQTIRAVGNVTIAHVFDAVDAVTNPANGQIVCRTTLADPTHGCAPFNVFGPNSASQEAIDYVRHGPGGEGSTTWERTRQHVFEASLNGQPFDTWAGPVALALGGGYRKESVDRRVDPGSNGFKISCLQVDPNCANPFPIPRGVPSSYLSRAYGAYFFSNQQPIKGGYDLWETFGEVLVPLAKDTAFAQSLDLNGAVRYTHYSLSGGVTTWKLGLNWQPVSDIRFRATRSRDIRAPNLSELYSTSSAGAGAVTETLPDGSLRTSTVVSLASGSTTLTPEKADTLTVGGVFTPSFAPGFQISVDYYNIAIHDAIGNLGIQNIVDQCQGGATALCANIERDTDGVIFRVNNAFLNIAEMKTSGLDIEASYRTQLGSGTLGFRAIASHVFELSTYNPGADPVDRAGQVGTSGGVPSWNFNFDLNYRNGPLGVSINERIIGKGTYNSTYQAGRDIDNNSIPAIAYTDLTASYRFQVGAKDWELFGAVNNLLDQAPPGASGSFFVFGTIPTNTYLYDTIGRAYTLGLRVKL